VVTNLTDDPETVYRLYCQRGNAENRLKELHHGLGAGPDKVLALSRQPVPRPADAGRVHPVPRTPAPRSRHRMRRRAGHHLAGAADQARRMGPALGSSDPPTLAGDVSRAPDVVPGRPRGRSDLVSRAGNRLRGATTAVVSVPRGGCRLGQRRRRPPRSTRSISRAEFPSATVTRASTPHLRPSPQIQRAHSRIRQASGIDRREWARYTSQRDAKGCAID
jgi:hypothetical protein